MKKIDVNQLLSREPISIDVERISSYLKDKVVLVTGAGGSIGSELCRQVVTFKVKKIILLDIYENNLYELGRELNHPSVLEIVADVKDKENLEKIFKKHQIQIIFHAAAHKHVPLMEQEPQEAVKNNILGTDNLIRLAEKYGLEKFIFVSTDKAINPMSIMGATKRFSEEEIRSLSSKKTIYAIVRFGNVLGSYGSVIPLWEKQLKKGEPLTVTHAKMKRFFMTIPEAVELIIQAGAMAKGVDNYVLKMGKQYKILDLANGFIKLCGMQSKIIITQPRPGEKLSETLHENGERLEKSAHPMIAKIIPAKIISSEKVNQALNTFARSINNLERKEVIKILKTVVQGYIPYQELAKPKKLDMAIPFSPPSISEQEKKAVLGVLDSGWLTMGEKVLEFEKQFAELHRIDHAIAVNSATAGLHLALDSLGVGSGDEVILPSYTFASCANTIVWTGAKPVFADIKKQGFLIDPIDIAKKITKKTKAIMAVHYGGQMADMDEIMQIAKKYKLKVIEDCAHSPLATYKGKLAGTIGDIGVFSFYATKNMMTGEGGMVITKNSLWVNKMRILRLHGMSADGFNRYSGKGKWFYEILEPGYNYVLTDMAAALGLEQLKKLENFNRKRAEIANQYLSGLAVSSITLPEMLSGRKSVWHLFPILVEPNLRDWLIESLKEYNIATSVHFIPLHLQPYYLKNYGYKKGDLPVSEWVYEREISLPIYPDLDQRKQEYIVRALKYLLSYA